MQASSGCLSIILGFLGFLGIVGGLVMTLVA